MYEASIAQLKRLIISYRLNYSSSTYTVLWHTALVYVANSLLRHMDDDDWFFHFRVCLFGYEGLQRSWRVAEVMSKALLSMSIRSGGVSSSNARRMLAELQKSNPHKERANLRAPFIVDLNLSAEDPNLATGENLARSFEDNALLQDYTTEFNSEEVMN